MPRKKIYRASHRCSGMMEQSFEWAGLPVRSELCRPTQLNLSGQPEFVVVTNRDFRPIWCPQAQFNPCVPAINVHFGIRRLEKYIVVRKEPAVAIIPTAEFGKTSLDVAEVGFRQLHPYVVIVEIPERVTIDREQAVFVKSSLKVQILDPSV